MLRAALVRAFDLPLTQKRPQITQAKKPAEAGLIALKT
jgi:hypothetical protein